MNVFHATVRLVNQRYRRMIEEIGGEQNLPSGFNVSGKGWLDAEAEIEESVFCGFIEKTKELCTNYQERALKYFLWGKENAKVSR